MTRNYESKSGNRASQKESDNIDNHNDQNIYAYMAHMSGNDESFSINYGDSFILTNWILYLVATFHMTPQDSDFLTGSLEDKDKYIEIADGGQVMVKQKVQFRKTMRDNNRDTFIATLHNVILAPDICKGLFSMITLMNSGHHFLVERFLHGVLWRRG